MAGQHASCRPACFPLTAGSSQRHQSSLAIRTREVLQASRTLVIRRNDHEGWCQFGCSHRRGVSRASIHTYTSARFQKAHRGCFSIWLCRSSTCAPAPIENAGDYVQRSGCKLVTRTCFVCLRRQARAFRNEGFGSHAGRYWSAAPTIRGCIYKGGFRPSDLWSGVLAIFWRMSDGESRTKETCVCTSGLARLSQ